MNQLQQCKFVNAVIPVAIVNNASVASTVIDATGFSYLTVVVQLGATDIALTALKLQNSSTSGGSYADVTGATYSGGTVVGGATASLPTATDDNKVYVFHVDLAGKDPFFKLVCTVGSGATGAFVSAIGILSRPDLTGTTSLDFASGGEIRIA